MMSEGLVYQSVLQKLGQLSPQHLVELDTYLAFLVQKQTKGNAPSMDGISSLDQYFGAWKDWKEEEFQSFLNHTQEIRKDLFVTRELDL